MEFFKPGLYIDFMRHRRLLGSLSLFLATASLVALFVPGPKFGIDFKGGTELEMAFSGKVGPGELRQAIMKLGLGRPDVVNVEDKKQQYIIRVLEVSTIDAKQLSELRKALEGALGEVGLEQMKVSPGGDKVSMRLSGAVDVRTIREALEAGGSRVRSVSPFGQEQDHRYEALLWGVADKLVRGLQKELGERVPETPLRVEWVGPKAGAKLRDSAIKSLLYAVAFIMVYVAFRFDLRFAPGGVVAMVHDVLITMGIFVLLQKEVTLATVAALLTVVGYSINDTIVVYDRIRENMQRMRDTSLYHLINVSTSQTLSRSVITSVTTVLSIVAFFVWGTPIIRDIVFALMVGILIGTYSSIYVAAPFTEWMDRRFFRKF